MKYHSTYKNCDIYFSTQPGYALKWSSYCEGMFIHSDTLDGIKRLITHTIKEAKHGLR